MNKSLDNILDRLVRIAQAEALTPTNEREIPLKDELERATQAIKSLIQVETNRARVDEADQMLEWALEHQPDNKQLIKALNNGRLTRFMGEGFELSDKEGSK